MPLRETATWWQPSLCALLRDWARGKVGSFVACTCKVEEPLAERTPVGVVAREKMSVAWAVV